MSDFNFFDGELSDTENKTVAAKCSFTAEQQIERASVHNGDEANYAKIDCPKCGGRGYKTYGYVNIRSYPCGMCKETGKVTAKRIASVEAFKKGLATKAANLNERRNAFHKEHGDLVRFLEANRDWSNFYFQLAEQVAERGELSEKQIAAVRSGMAKKAARDAERKAQREASAPEADLAAIHAMFDTARSNGLCKLAYRAKGLVISPAGAQSANAGALYVKTSGGTYLGKVVGSRFLCMREATDEHRAAVQEIAADPSRVARDYGKETGECCCCGRELTNAISIEMGIGPICAEKWGL